MFNKSWLEEAKYKKWLAEVSGDKNKAWCTVCCREIIIGSMGEGALRSHAAGGTGKGKGSGEFDVLNHLISSVSAFDFSISVSAFYVSVFVSAFYVCLCRCLAGALCVCLYVCVCCLCALSLSLTLTIFFITEISLNQQQNVCF